MTKEQFIPISGSGVFAGGAIGFIIVPFFTMSLEVLTSISKSGT